MADCPDPDVIVVPGGALWVPSGDQEYREWLQKWVPRTKLTLTVCNSAILLAELGLLDGKEATCGDANLDDLMLAGTNVKAYLNRRWVHSGNIVSCKSYLGGLDGAIYAVRALRGKDEEARVLAWVNYDGDLSRWDALHSEPGRVPVSRRREVVGILESDGVDMALAFFRDWEESARPRLSPELEKFGEENLFQWMAWGDLRRERFEHALLITEFMARAWPDSATGWVLCGEALLRSSRSSEALKALIRALELQPGNAHALGLLRETLRQPGLDSIDVRRGTEMLEKARRAESKQPGGL